MTLLSDVIQTMKDLGGECHLNDLYAKINSHPNDSIRQCLYLYSSDSDAYLGTKDIFKCVHGVSSRKGVWALRGQNNSYESILIDYLREHGTSTIDELYNYVCEQKNTGKTGKRYLREVVTNRYKGSSIFQYDNPNVSLRPEYLNSLNKKKELFEGLKNNLNEENKYIELTKLTNKSDNCILEIREGELTERKILSRKRNREVVKQVKIRDEYKCKSCNFYFYNKIVEAHHLTPLSEKAEDVVKIEDLITLCPNCHSITHYLLKEDAILYSSKEFLIEKLHEILRG